MEQRDGAARIEWVGGMLGVVNGSGQRIRAKGIRRVARRLAGCVIALAVVASVDAPHVVGTSEARAAEASPQARIGAKTAPSGPSTRPNVLLVVIDTLSARHLEAYGYFRATAPFLSEEAKHGVLFEDVTAAAPFTAPAMASIFTGLDGMHHGVGGHVPDLRFSRAHLTLADAFHEAGYTTIGVVANPWLSAARGFDQGFDRYLQRNEASAATLADLLLEQIRQVPAGTPWFAWLHLLDVHMPYSPAAADRDRFDPQASESLPIRHFRDRPFGVDTIFFTFEYSPRDIERTRALYDAAIFSVDAVLRRMLGRLREAPGGAELVAAYTADHGEALCEHGLCWSHEFSLYQELMAVPWIVRAPNRLPQGRRVADPVRSIDLAPTLADVVGVPFAATFDGSSATALERGIDGAGARPSFAESGPWREKYAKNPRLFMHGDAGRWKMARDGKWKLIVIPKPGGDELELYDLKADPLETANVSALHPDVVARLETRIKDWVATRVASPPEAAAAPLTIAPEDAESLRNLGYTSH